MVKSWIVDRMNGQPSNGGGEWSTRATNLRSIQPIVNNCYCKTCLGLSQMADSKQTGQPLIKIYYKIINYFTLLIFLCIVNQ
jgi:hypothetical protein